MASAASLGERQLTPIFRCVAFVRCRYEPLMYYSYTSLGAPILAALDSVLGAVRAELDGVYDNRIFISGFLVNAIVAVLLTFIGDRLGLDLYLVALLTFGLRIFDNVALIRRHFL